jgi:hypothetical protein
MCQHLRAVTTLLLALCSGSICNAQSPSGIPSGAGRKSDDELLWGTTFTDASLETLPNMRNLWSLLQSQDPSTVTNRLDVGGLETGVPALFGALGASWTENQYRLNGFDVTDPYLPGFPLIDPGLDSLTEFQVIAGAKPATFETSGVTLSLSAARPSEDTHGSAWMYYSSRGLQNDNFNARLAHFNFPGPERMNNLLDGGAQLGGTLPSWAGSLPIFSSVSTQQLSKDLGGFALPIDARVYRAMVDLAVFSRRSKSLDLLYSGQHVLNSRQGASPLVSPDATTRANQNFHQWQARWNQTINPSTSLTAGFGVVNAIVGSEFQAGVQGPSTIDLPEGSITGAAPLSLAGTRTRYEAQGLANFVLKGPAGAHNLNVGLDWNRSYVSNRWDALAGFDQILVQGVSSEVVRWNTPTEARLHVQSLSEFAQDSWRPAKWICLVLGLRVDTSSGRAAGQAAHINWTTLQPRAGFVVPLTRWNTFLKASWVRYGHVLQGRYLYFGDDHALGAQVFRWSDLNRDELAQPGELEQLTRVFGGPFSAIDPQLSRPFTDEISFGAEQNIGFGLSANVRFFRRDDHRLLTIRNVGVPSSDYDPVSFVDPGNDGVPGTPDDQVLTLFNRKPSALGRDFLELSNSGFHASYKGLEARLLKRFQHSWALSASFTATRTLATTSPGNSVFQADTGFVAQLAVDPNTLINAQGRTYFDRAFTGKIVAYYSAPRRFQFAVVASYYDGLPFGRLLFINGFNQGPFFVRATPVGHPGGFQTELNSTLDTRVARDFALKKGVLSAYVDFFNILNFNSNTQEADLTSPNFLSRVPLAVEAPRTARLGIRWKF